MGNRLARAGSAYAYIRSDCRYVAHFIAENHGYDSAPLLCVTATAQHNVVDDIGSISSGR